MSAPDLDPGVLAALKISESSVVGDFAATEDLVWMALAQAATTTVQDAAAHLRSTNTVAVAAIAKAFRGDAPDTDALKAAADTLESAAAYFKTVAYNAVEVLERRRGDADE